MKSPHPAMQFPNLMQTSSSAAAKGPSSSCCIAFSSNFSQPEPPLVKSEFRANWNQHMWNVNQSHIASGFLYNSPSQKKVRVDMAYDTTIASSLFDYNNITEKGVANRLWTLSPAVTSKPQIWDGFVEPDFPLVSDEFLVANNAVFRGVVSDQFLGREVTAWDIMYKGAIPTTVLVDKEGVIQGYDFWSTESRTRVVTRFFNIILGAIGKEVFDFPGQKSAHL